jgi:hypothetical protein
MLFYHTVEDVAEMGGSVRGAIPEGRSSTGQVALRGALLGGHCVHASVAHGHDRPAPNHNRGVRRNLKKLKDILRKELEEKTLIQL